MLDEYGCSSDDDFPDIDEIMRQYQHKIRDTKSHENTDGNKPTTLNARSQTDKSVKESTKSNSGVKATPLRRRKLGSSQNVDGSLLKPWNGREDKDRQQKSGGSDAPTRVLNTLTDTSSKNISKPMPARLNKAGSRAVSLNKGEAAAAKEKEKPKQDAEIQGRQTKNLPLSEEIKELVALLGDFDDEESDILGDKQESSEEDSEFIAISDSESDAWVPKSQVSLAPPTRRSKSPNDNWARPQRTLFADPSKRVTSSKEQTKVTSKDPVKHASKPRKQDDSRLQSLKVSQPENLEDAFQKLQIFNEDSEPELPTRGDRKPSSVLEPMTPKKTLPASPCKTPKIPKSPWKPEHKEFWDPEENFGWIDKHSPEKKPESPKKKQEQDGSKASARRTNAAKRATKLAFDAIKEEMARNFLQELDNRITDGQLAQLTKDTGGLQITWSNTLNSTAGRAHWKCKILSSTVHSDGSVSIAKRHSATIELASKVLNNETDLLNTVAHEFCHLAVFILSGKPKMAHGPEFKSWGAKCGRAFANRGIVVTTKHNYEIEYKYVWRCADCTFEVRRHSKSVNPERHRCGSCKGRLLQISPTPRNGGNRPTTPTNAGGGSGDLQQQQQVPTTAKKQRSQWQLFMAREMKIMSQTRSMSSKDRLAAVAAKWHSLSPEEKQNQSQMAETEQRGRATVKALQGAVEILTIDD